MSERLVELGLHLERQVEVAQYNLERGTLDPVWLERQAAGTERALKDLEGQIHTLPEETRDRLLLKLESIKTQLFNLGLAAKIGSAPPKRTSLDSRIRHLDRNSQTSSTPTNDECDGAFVIDFGSYAGNTADATNDGEASCGASMYTADVWYRFVAPDSGTVVVDTVGSSFDTVLSVHTGCPGTMSNELRCNDDASGLQAATSFFAYTGNEYLIRVSGANGATGAYVVTLSEGGSIEGTVSMADTGSPAGIPVKAFNEIGYQVGSDYSDSSGIYRIDNLFAPGDYFVATDTNYSARLNELYDNIPCPYGPPSGCDVTTGDAVSVVIGGVTGGIDFVLGSGAVITGVVREEQTTTPIPGADIYLYEEDGSSEGHHVTDSSGMYSFNNLAEGHYFVAVTASAYLDELYDDVPCPGRPPYGCSVADGTLVEATPNTTTSGIDFDLIKLGSIRGRVTDRATGLPISSANVRVYHYMGGTTVGTGYADATGAYEVGGLEDGTYYLTAHRFDGHVTQLFDGIDCPAEGCQVLTGTQVVISNQATVHGIDFELTTKGNITGNVIDSTTSMPIQGVVVRLYNDSGSSLGYESTDSGGHFELDKLDAGDYFLATDDSEYINEVYDNIPCLDDCDPTTGTPVQVLNEQTTSGIDFSLVPGGKMTGSVTAEDGSGNLTMLMRLYDSFGNYLDYDYSYGGVYEFVGLDAGQYLVVADSYASTPYLEELFENIDCWGGPNDGCVVTEGTPVTVATATLVSGIDFSLKSGGKISGLVVDAVDGTPVSGRVYVREVPGSGVWDAVLSNGAYSVEGLIPGDYLVIADAANHVDEVWQDLPCAGEYPPFCGLSGATSVSVGPASETIIDFSLQRLATISGTVRSAVDGSPLSWFYVRAFDTLGDPVATDYANSLGEYDLTNLWPATLFVVTDENSLNFIDQLFDAIDCAQGPPEGCDPTTGTPVVVEVNTSLQNIDFSLEPTGIISGHVTDSATGLPLSGINVEVWDADGNYRRYDSTDSLGFYELQGLESGTFFIATDEFNSSSTILDILYDGVPCPTGPPDGCDPTKGTPVSVLSGETTRFIDLVLPPSGGSITGIVQDLGTGEPIFGVFIDLWDATSGDYELGVLTSQAGTFIADVSPGTYVAATDNSGDWVNQIFDGIECFAGSPYNGDCDPMMGAVITVEDSALTPDINFQLRSSSGTVFANGFETGDTTRWDATVP